MKDRHAFATLMIGLGELFDKSISKALIEIYWTALKGFTDLEIKTAFNQVALQKEWFPKPIHIIELIQGSKEGKAGEAYQCLIQAVGQVGAYNSIIFEDVGIQAVVMAWGGWVSVCERKYDDWRYVYTLKHFQPLYEHLKIENPTQRPLSGIAAAENESKGLNQYIPEPVKFSMQAGVLKIERTKPQITEGQKGSAGGQDMKIDLTKFSKRINTHQEGVKNV